MWKINRLCAKVYWLKIISAFCVSESIGCNAEMIII